MTVVYQNCAHKNCAMTYENIKEINRFEHTISHVIFTYQERDYVRSVSGARFPNKVNSCIIDFYEKHS